GCNNPAEKPCTAPTPVCASAAPAAPATNAATAAPLNQRAIVILAPSCGRVRLVGSGARGVQPARLLDKTHDVGEPLTRSQIGKDERPLAAHSPGIPIHNAEIRPDQR